MNDTPLPRIPAPQASKGPKKRDPACLQLQQDIVIPRGTILRQEPGKQGVFRCPVGTLGDLCITLKPGENGAPDYRQVIA